MEFIKTYKDIFIFILSLFSLLFSIYTFFKKFNEDTNSKKLDIIQSVLNDFYFPILINYNNNKNFLISDDIKKFFYQNSILFDEKIFLLFTSLIELETNISCTLKNKYTKKKYITIKKHFIYCASSFYNDYSKLYRYNIFNINSKYFFPYFLKLSFSILDFIAFFIIIFLFILIFYIDIYNLYFIIFILFTISIIWITQRSDILNMVRSYHYKNSLLSKRINIHNYFFYNQISQFDAIYKNIFSNKYFLVYKGMPIIHKVNKKNSNKKRISNNFFTIYKLHKRIAG